MARELWSQLSMVGNRIVNLGDPSADSDAATKGWAKDRSNHTGTQTASTISDFDTQVQTNRLDEMAAPTASVSLNTQKITDLAAPTNANDAARLVDIQNAQAGFNLKDSVRAATTGPGTLATSFANGQSIDGVALVTGDRILIKDQADASENGIYIVAAAGAPARASDADSADEIRAAMCYVEEGGSNEGTVWVLTTDPPLTIDATDLTFAQFGGGITYAAGNGLSLTGTTFAVGAGTGISVDSTTVSIDTAVVARHYETTIGDGATSNIVVTHNLGTRDIDVTVRKEATPYTVIDVEWEPTTTNTATLKFATAPTSNQFRAKVTA